MHSHGYPGASEQQAPIRSMLYGSTHVQRLGGPSVVQQIGLCRMAEPDCIHCLGKGQHAPSLQHNRHSITLNSAMVFHFQQKQTSYWAEARSASYKQDLKEEIKAIVSLAPVTKHVCSDAGDLCCTALQEACNMIFSVLQFLILADTTTQTFASACTQVHARVLVRTLFHEDFPTMDFGTYCV